MKLMHLADLHLGKRLNDFSLLEDQSFILKQILHIAVREHVDAVLIAGDVYDKSTPSAEAVLLLDTFLFELSQSHIDVYLIAGNHDSAERLSFGSRLMEKGGLYISKVYDGAIEPIVAHDDYGEVRVYLLPFIKPTHVRAMLEKRGEEPRHTIESYTDAVDEAISRMQIDRSVRNVLVTHQFVTGSVRCDSEDFSVGGTDNVDARVFDGFDYVALGHIHSPQKIGSETIRYSGTPLKYSFSESMHKKSVCIVSLAEKGSVQIELIPLEPLHDVRELKGTFSELTKTALGNPEDYLHITLTDEDDVPDALSRLRLVYPRIMKLDYDNARTRTSRLVQGMSAAQKKSPLEVFSEFYESQNNAALSDAQTAFLSKTIESLLERRA